MRVNWSEPFTVTNAWTRSAIPGPGNRTRRLLQSASLGELASVILTALLSALLSASWNGWGASGGTGGVGGEERAWSTQELPCWRCGRHLRCAELPPSGYHQGRETDDISVGNDNDFTTPILLSLVLWARPCLQTRICLQHYSGVRLLEESTELFGHPLIMAWIDVIIYGMTSLMRMHRLVTRSVDIFKWIILPNVPITIQCSLVSQMLFPVLMGMARSATGHAHQHGKKCLARKTISSGHH